MTRNYEEINEAQTVSETDPFTIERYQQFYQHLPISTKIILDVGCNTGRGGSVLRNLNKDLHIIGLDCLESRLEKIPPGIYDTKVCSYSLNKYCFRRLINRWNCCRRVYRTLIS
jgi:predicted TPR repeat methyltransferase